MNKQELIEKYNNYNLSGASRRALLICFLRDLEQLDEPQSDPIKLKDVIARIKKLDLGAQEVWLNEILNELGSDYGTLKYKAGYEQGKIEGALIHCEEPQKITVPKFVADWIEKCKSEKKRLHESLTYTPFGVNGWVSNPENQETFALAWINGYTVEEEKRYYVRFKGMESGDFNYLNFIKFQHAWVLSSLKIDKKFRTEHTKKQLEEAGFGWVFDCEGIEIEEVENEFTN